MEKYGTQEHMEKSRKGTSSWGESAGHEATSRNSTREKERPRDDMGRFVSPGKSGSGMATRSNKTWG